MAVGFNVKRLCQRVENASFCHSTLHTTLSSPNANSWSANAGFHHSTRRPYPITLSSPNGNPLSANAAFPHSTQRPSSTIPSSPNANLLSANAGRLSH